MLRGALIGLGNIAVRGHIPALAGDPALKSKASLVAVVDVTDSSREKAREYLPAAKFYPDVSSLMASEQIDFVDICTPVSSKCRTSSRIGTM